MQIGCFFSPFDFRWLRFVEVRELSERGAEEEEQVETEREKS